MIWMFLDQFYLVDGVDGVDGADLECLAIFHWITLSWILAREDGGNPLWREAKVSLWKT